MRNNHRSPETPADVFNLRYRPEIKAALNDARRALGALYDASALTDTAAIDDMYDTVEMSFLKEVFESTVHHAFHHDGDLPCIHLLQLLQGCNDIMAGDVCADLRLPEGSTCAQGVQRLRDFTVN